MSCVNKCCDIFCSRCKQTRGAQRAYRCLGCMCRWLCEKLLRRKRVFAESDTKITIKGVFENCGVGDLVFISQLVAFDSTCKVSSFIASDIFLAHDCQSLIRDSKTIFGWDKVGIIIEGKEGSSGPLNIMEVGKEGFKVYDLFDRIQLHSMLHHTLGICHLSGTFENDSHREIFYEIIQDTKNMDIKHLYKKEYYMVKVAFDKIKEHASYVDQNSIMYKEYRRKFVSFAKGGTSLSKEDVFQFLFSIWNENNITKQEMKVFYKDNIEPIRFENYENGKMQFDDLYMLLKKTIFQYKSYFEINVESVASAMIMAQILAKLNVIESPELNELMTCDQLRLIAGGGSPSNIKMNPRFSYKALHIFKSIKYKGEKNE